MSTVLTVWMVLHFGGLLLLIRIDPGKKHPRHQRQEDASG